MEQKQGSPDLEKRIHGNGPNEQQKWIDQDRELVYTELSADLHKVGIIKKITLYKSFYFYHWLMTTIGKKNPFLSL